MLIINIIISSIIQIILFSIIPYLWWFITKRKKIKFLEWIGIKKPKISDKRKFITLFLVTTILFLMLSISMLIMVKDLEIATSEFTGLGFKALLPAIIYAFIQTAFTEELFFRGFLTKVLINGFGFKLGNFIQSLTFGLLHLVMFYGVAGFYKSFIIFLFTGVIAWFMGYINEKLADSSIYPSWLMHGVSNMFSSIISMFNII